MRIATGFCRYAMYNNDANILHTFIKNDLYHFNVNKLQVNSSFLLLTQVLLVQVQIVVHGMQTG